MNVLILFGIRRNCDESFYLFIKQGDETDCSNYGGMSLLSTTYKFYPTSCCQGYLLMQKKLLGIINVDFDETGRLLIIYSAFVKYLKK